VIWLLRPADIAWAADVALVGLGIFANVMQQPHRARENRRIERLRKFSRAQADGGQMMGEGFPFTLGLIRNGVRVSLHQISAA
jgi:hypothetical protein